MFKFPEKFKLIDQSYKYHEIRGYKSGEILGLGHTIEIIHEKQGYAPFVQIGVEKSELDAIVNTLNSKGVAEAN